MTVGVSVAGKVMESVSGTGLGASVAGVAVVVMVAVVAVTVPLVGAMEAADEGVEVLEGRGLLVIVAVRLGVWDGSGVGWVVNVATAVTRFALNGRPDPIKITRIPAKSRSAIALKKIP